MANVVFKTGRLGSLLVTDADESLRAHVVEGDTYRWDTGTLAWVRWDGALTAGSITIGKVDQGAAGAAKWLVTADIAANQTVGLSAGSQVIGHVILDASSAVIGHVIVDSGTITAVTTVTAVTSITNVVSVSLAAETTKVIGTVNQGTSPWVTNATLSAETTKVIGTVNQGTSPWAVSLAVETTKVIGTVNVASGQTIAVTNTGTFAVQAALNAETTKVIGTVNIAASQTIAVTNVGTFAVQNTETRPASPTVTRIDWSVVTISDSTRAATILAANTARRGATIRNSTDGPLVINEGGTASPVSYTEIIPKGQSYVLAYPACTALISAYVPQIPFGDIFVTERV